MSDMADRIINMRYLRLFRVLIKFGFIQATAYPPAFCGYFRKSAAHRTYLVFFKPFICIPQFWPDGIIRKF